MNSVALYGIAAAFIAGASLSFINMANNAERVQAEYKQALVETVDKSMNDFNRITAKQLCPDYRAMQKAFGAEQYQVLVDVARCDEYGY